MEAWIRRGSSARRQLDMHLRLGLDGNTLRGIVFFCLKFSRELWILISEPYEFEANELRFWETNYGLIIWNDIRITRGLKIRFLKEMISEGKKFFFMRVRKQFFSSCKIMFSSCKIFFSSCKILFLAASFCKQEFFLTVAQNSCSKEKSPCRRGKNVLSLCREIFSWRQKTLLWLLLLHSRTLFKILCF